MPHLKKKSLNEKDLFIWNQYINNSKFILKKNIFENKFTSDSSIKINGNNNKVLIKNKKLHKRDNSFSLNKKTFKKIKKNIIHPEKTIDLHGKSQAEARRMIFEFIINCYRNNNKFLLIITGKGSKIENERFYFENKNGILKRNFPKWINEEPISKYIISFSSAYRFHGGDGAFYVFLKSNKNL